MSDTILNLAEKILASPDDGSPQWKLAERLLEEHKRGVWLSERFTLQNDKLNAKVHECEALRESRGASVRVTRREPELAVYCSNPDCTTQPLTWQVAPPDEAVPVFVRGRGWLVDGDQHWCRVECRR